MKWLDIDTKTRKSLNSEGSWNDTYDLLNNAIQYWNSGYTDSDSFDEVIKLYKSKNLGYNNTVKEENNKKESNNSMFDASNMMNKYFGKVASGMVRLSMSGDMAIKTPNGYKTYDVKTGTLTNCDSFVFDIGSEMFFLIPTNKVQKGDIILASGKPHCVIGAEKNCIEALRYEDGSIVNIVPERHVFCGHTYFYGKIMSMFGDMKNKGMNSMMKYAMLTEMMKDKASGNFSNMLPMMFLMGNNGRGMEDMFSDMFDLDIDAEENSEKE